jgi:NAD(P)-dependent dehydrogenase (short-subunit alcohol dehydrogenase family)
MPLPSSPSVNNAGTAFFSPILGEPNVEQLAKIFQLNVIGPFFMVNSVVPHMPRGGRIINISSTNAKRGNAAISSYAASKAALDNLTWTWAEEVGPSPCCDANGADVCSSAAAGVSPSTPWPPDRC